MGLDEDSAVISESRYASEDLVSWARCSFQGQVRNFVDTLPYVPSSISAAGECWGCRCQLQRFETNGVALGYPYPEEAHPWITAFAAPQVHDLERWITYTHMTQAEVVARWYTKRLVRPSFQLSSLRSLKNRGMWRSCSTLSSNRGMFDARQLGETVISARASCH